MIFSPKIERDFPLLEASLTDNVCVCVLILACRNNIYKIYQSGFLPLFLSGRKYPMYNKGYLLQSLQQKQIKKGVCHA